ncbi:MAG: MobQ family relaxase [Armatimonadota bacterium]|nr:MobQ family relaxase [Armatimonadota bacterium]
MAIYYLAAQVISRSAGRSAVAAAAYRAGERLVDERTGQTHDFSSRREIEAEILAPEGAPEWALDRAELWNQVEAAERRKDAQLCREIVIALPRELSPEQQRELIRGYVQEQFVARGMVADVAIHRQDANNPHAHVMLTMREIGPEGFGKKVREWNQPELLEQWREAWARHANLALERAGEQVRIDHRSYERQGVDLLPQQHMGPEVTALERRGIRTEIGDHNRLVAEHNAIVIDLQKARQEREILRRERDRLASGLWRREEAAAVAAVERQLGRVVTPEELARLHRQGREQLHQLHTEITRIHQEGDRLRRAGESVARLEQAEERLAALDSPWQKVKRLFSREARNRYEAAKRAVEAARSLCQQDGVTGRADLLRQQQLWQRQHDRLPELNQRIDRLNESMHAISRALAAFDRAAERERREREREHERSRERGR